MAISVAYEGMKQSLKTQQRRVSADQQVTPLKENETGEVIEGCFHKYIRAFSSAGSCIHYFCDIACKYLCGLNLARRYPVSPTWKWPRQPYHARQQRGA